MPRRRKALSRKYILATIAFGLCLYGCKPSPKVEPTRPTKLAAGQIQAASVERVDVEAAINQAQDGDTVVVPAGTATWTTTLKLDKGITLKGQTTVMGGGTKDATADDKTVIIDGRDASGGPDVLSYNGTKPLNLSGFTFKAGTTTPGSAAHAALSVYGQGGQNNIQIHDLHFDLLNCRATWFAGWWTGVIYNVLINTQGHNQSFYFEMAGWNGKDFGHGAWADYPWFGTDKFMFVEDCSVFGNVQGKGGFVDNMNGARWVIRHCYFKDAGISGHGTESGPQRGNRIGAVYNCTFDWVTAGVQGGQGRSGTFIFHDNVWPSNGPANNEDWCYLLKNYRTVYRAKYWGYAQGTNPWDENDTEGNNTFVEGHAPKMFDSGITTGASVQLTGPSRIRIEDSTKHWTKDQWAGYSVTNVSSPQKFFGMLIMFNEATTLDYANNWASDNPQDQWVKFAIGDHYEIYRVVAALDQSGKGKGDLLENFKGQYAINTRTGTQGFPRQQQEICYSWNNVVTKTGQALGLGAATTILDGRDVINIGKGQTGIPTSVQQHYVASRNGVDYKRELDYPHPLRSGVNPSPIPTQTPNVTPTQTPRPSPTTTATSTPTATATSTPTATAVPTKTPTPRPSPTPTPKPSPSPSPTVAPTPLPINPPSDLSYKIVQGKRVQLSWNDNSDNEVAFEVQRSGDNGVWAIAVTLPRNASTWKDPSTSKNNRYLYRVRAKGTGNNYSAWTDVIEVTP